MPCRHRAWLALPVCRRRRCGSQRRGRVQDVPGQPLVQVRLGRRDPEVAQLDPTVGPGQVEGPVAGGRRIELVGQGQRRLPAVGHGGGERQGGARARSKTDRPPQGEHRVEYRTDGTTSRGE